MIFIYLASGEKGEKGNKTFDDYLDIIMCNKVINSSSSLRYLDTVIDQKLTWREDITHIVTKISQSSGIMHKVKRLLPSDNLNTLYYTLIYLYLQYCNALWGMTIKTVLNPLFMIQKRVIRLIANVNNDAHTLSIF